MPTSFPPAHNGRSAPPPRACRCVRHPGRVRGGPGRAVQHGRRDRAANRCGLHREHRTPSVGSSDEPDVVADHTFAIWQYCRCPQCRWNERPSQQIQPTCGGLSDYRSRAESHAVHGAARRVRSMVVRGGAESCFGVDCPDGKRSSAHHAVRLSRDPSGLTSPVEPAPGDRAYLQPMTCPRPARDNATEAYRYRPMGGADDVACSRPVPSRSDRSSARVAPPPR
jgi:hypothetical protein